jgi:YHS domain-containing protein
MHRLVVILILVTAIGCGGTPQQPASTAEVSQVQTIHSTPPTPAPLNPPPMLQDEAPPPKPKAMPWEKPTPIVLTPEDEKLRASLPFSPAIAMDPIDGDKVSIRATTPTFEYKGRIYYFRSEANRRAFEANPQAYLTGKFTNL